MERWYGILHKHRGVIAPLAFVLMLGVLVVPMPPVVLDVLLCLNIALAVMILMTTMYMQEPLEFSVFPSLLLGTTLFRLVLNVASTRLVLTADASNPQEALYVAGEVVAAFGGFVAGQSLVVGVVIFSILMIIQFVVITKGATRISEVAARFTLDAMPGKQLAIDADLNAGIINEAEARRRRERVGQEADFFGAMDGASKFVRGDAIAGMIITAVNILGGVVVGTVQRGWSFAETAEVFTKLTIGDGLTSAVPSFVIAIASALIVTRSGAKSELGQQLTGQLTAKPIGLGLTAGFMAALALTPLPTAPLLLTAAGLGAMAWATSRSGKTQAKRADQAVAAQARPEPPTPESMLKLDTMELEVGYGLVGLVDTAQGGDLLDRISGVRRQLASELGFIMPPVRIRDNLQLGPNDYRVRIKGNSVGRGSSVPGRLLAIDPGIASEPIDGIPGKEPAFGLDAVWIEPAQRTRAETANYTVVEPSAVIATHLTEIVRANAAELLTRHEVGELVAQLKARAPKLVEDTVPSVLKMADLHRVLQNLLRERVPIRDLETVIETLADWIGKTKDLDVLTEYARHGLRRTISHQHALPDPAGRLRLVCVTLDPSLEDEINAYVERTGGGTSVNMPAGVAQRVVSQLGRGLAVLTQGGHQPVILCSPVVRGVVRQLVESAHPSCAVLGYNEIVAGVEVESVALVTTGVPDTGGDVAGRVGSAA
ncbi:MAG: flagellar biosynthesis protein FlhA [Planctomyces sp.]|nr:flagellar biosynthesis protein FlhA [Planctomyces sp.]